MIYPKRSDLSAGTGLPLPRPAVQLIPPDRPRPGPRSAPAGLGDPRRRERTGRGLGSSCAEHAGDLGVAGCQTEDGGRGIGT